MANSNHIPSTQVVEAPDQDSSAVARKQKPRCWEHGCKGRTFSTCSNLLRHQKEKSGQAPKPSFPDCGAKFTRVTARNGHLKRQKCKAVG
ncbi:hypothetical protein F5883DRAFT_438406 [Diaporthe sp. PMI_573]|nr:hypothetical protein F5883DRAFT_438406 [Diaporthaceae sp. PMI_573]